MTVIEHDDIEFFDCSGLGNKAAGQYCGDDAIIFTVKLADGWTKVSPGYIVRANSDVSIMTQVKKILEKEK